MNIDFAKIRYRPHYGPHHAEARYHYHSDYSPVDLNVMIPRDPTSPRPTYRHFDMPHHAPESYLRSQVRNG